MRTWLFTVRLRMTSAGGVGGPERQPVGLTERVAHRIPLRRDHLDRVVLPGTTVAGSLRAHCADGGLPGELFGSSPVAEKKKASPIEVLGVRTHAEPEIATTMRVSLDRHRGAARPHHLFSVEQLTPGAEFDVHLRWNDADEEQLESFRAALRTWRPRLGRGTSLGAGACAVIGIGEADYDLATVDGLLDWLGGGSMESYPTPVTLIAEPAEPEAVLDVWLRIVDGVHVGVGSAEPGSCEPEIAALVTQDNQPMIPGSSLKGVFRSRVEYICRVLGRLACDRGDCGGCIPCGLFGWAPAPGAVGLGARARIAVGDARIEQARSQVRHHVALDRVTGGARPKLLYARRVVTTGRIRVRIEPLRPLAPVETALLHAVVTDLDAGLVGLGSATTRGLGTVRIDDETWQTPDLAALAALVSGGVA